VRAAFHLRLLVALSIAALAAPAARAEPLRFSPLRGARAEITGLMLSDAERGMRVTPRVGRVERSATTTLAAVLIPRGELLPAAAGSIVEVHVYAFSAAGPTAVLSAARRIDGREMPDDWNALRLEITADLPADAVALRVLVYERSRRLWGRVDVELPAPDATSSLASAGTRAILDAAVERRDGFDVEPSGVPPVVAGTPPTGGTPTGASPAPPAGDLGGGQMSFRGMVLVREYVQAYREAAQGDLQSAVARITRMESESTDPYKPNTLKPLDKTEARILRQIVREDPKALVPLVRLYQDVVEAHALEGRSLLVVRARERAVKIALAYAEIDKEKRAAAESSRLLTALASASMQTSGLRAGNELVFQAVELDPTNVTAALLMGRKFVNGDELRNAVKVLRPVAGSSVEAKLRLAVLLARTEETDEAVRLLQQVAGVPGTRWESAVAMEELARIAVARGAFDEAIVTLRAAVERFPNDANARIALAYCLLRSGDKPGLRRAIDEVGPGAGEQARSRYAEWNWRLLERSRQDLETLGETYQPILARVVATLFPVGARR